ncbi:hypothetical protein RvY_00357 [Ramazzottius varieornatus]|uniref:Uncharacterized protein n=1 Tax=Ramazzottius varieornatus TaxID=947166 RepID=A0A1D1UJV8_RAMVA|nr:hypothetical protein RvY_00357 [Ramazzottius varieornatus]
MALTLDMKAVPTTKKWDGDDGVSYGESPASGDQIVVRHAKQQSSKAKVVIITASKTEAEGLQKTLDEQARHNALDLFVGRGFGLQAALGNGVVTDIVGWINSFHSVSMHDERARVTSTEVVTVFGKRLYNMRKSMNPGEGTSGVQSKDLVFESDDEPL